MRDFLPSTPLLRGSFWVKKQGILENMLCNHLIIKRLRVGGKTNISPSVTY